MCGIDEYLEAPAYKITSKISLSSTEVLIIYMAENERVPVAKHISLKDLGPE